MKTKQILSLAAAVLLTVTGCSKKQTSGSSDTSTSEASNVTVGVEPVTVHENPRVDYTREEVREIIDKYPNLKVIDDNFYASVPKEIDHLCEFYSSCSYQLPPEKELEEFRSVFKYLFPDHELDENCLYAYACLDDEEEPNDPEENFKLRFHSLKNEDNYNAYMNGTLGNQRVMHCLIYTEEKFPRENSVDLSFRSPFGNDYCVFNKGVFDKFRANLRGEDKYYAREQYKLGANDFEAVGAYPPDSEKTFKLLDDKDISIKDAVSFFENYIASIPVFVPGLEESVFGIHVKEVNVYKLDDEHYGFEFINSRIYDGIHFNYVWDGSAIDGLNRDMSYGIMVESDDVDHVYAPFKAWRAYDEVQHTEFVPFEEAVKTVSEKMTEYVGFEVMRAEMLFREKSNVGSDELVGEDRDPAYPSWKFTLYNPNDNIRYVAYVNALTGEFEGGR